MLDMETIVLRVGSHLAGFSLPLLGAVLGQLLVQLHVDVLIVCGAETD